MTKAQFWILNVASLVLAAVLLSHFFFVRHNNQLGASLSREQAYINNARQLETLLDQLAKRIAKGSETDPKLKDILVKYGMTVTLETDGKKKTYP
ncbi:MAG: hypothetical protein HY298_10930 [Verrucomicrobia bacterium]|nr:hypothetical protein [Verrucomicrobiota bacterium]